MELIDQRTKKIMEGCKERARENGLRFADQTLEYIVTNKDLLELTPKLMIPTLYDYWVQDVEVFKEKGRYELYPGNPYETVINTRPAISFYNDNNPDWLNVMIFYHVLAHIDFFQNNEYFRHTWDFDFAGHALSDKRLIANLRSAKGRWVDYIIEFTRGIDNLVGYFNELNNSSSQIIEKRTSMMDYYFDVFLQSEKKVSIAEYIKEIERYNKLRKKFGHNVNEQFFAEILKKNPEFDALYKKFLSQGNHKNLDLIQYIINNSKFINQDKNFWVKSIMEIVRNTSVFFQPQIRTKIINEGWASYWHEKLFLADDRIKGHEVEFARVDAGITSLPNVGLNPYALGMRLFKFIEELVDKGRYSTEFNRISDYLMRDKFDHKTTNGLDFIYSIRKSFCDFNTINTFITQDFVNRYNLFVTGKRLNKDKMVWEYFIKSRKAEDYKNMLIASLYHPPYINVDESKNDNNSLYLYHHFEGKPLVKEFINNTMLGIEYLWGGPVKLETSEVKSITTTKSNSSGSSSVTDDGGEIQEIKWQRVIYSMENRRLTKKLL